MSEEKLYNSKSTVKELKATIDKLDKAFTSVCVESDLKPSVKDMEILVLANKAYSEASKKHATENVELKKNVVMRDTIIENLNVAIERLKNDASIQDAESFKQSEFLALSGTRTPEEIKSLIDMGIIK